ncbi:hypothetical protein [Aeromonas enteropelogenes]|uniref:hypothetical protein n=1 Tax=Aeromonas enteropelogenes TaxID=29489 RepID=UPI003F747697
MGLKPSQGSKPIRIGYTGVEAEKYPCPVEYLVTDAKKVLNVFEKTTVDSAKEKKV